MSILSWELFAILVLLGGAGIFIVADHDGEQLAKPRKGSLRGHDTLLEQVCFTPDGKTLISCGWDKTVRFWAVEEQQTSWGRETNSLSSSSHLFSVASTSDGNYLAAAGADGLHVWSRDGNSDWQPFFHSKSATGRSVAIASDNRTLASARSDGSIGLWDIPSRKEIGVLSGFADDIRRVDLSSDGSFVAGATFGGEFRIWALRSGGQPCELPLKVGRVHAFAISPDSRTLAVVESGDCPDPLSIWDLKTASVVQRFAGNPTGTNALAFSPDGRIIATADVDETIRIWDLVKGELTSTMHEGVGWVKTIAFAPDGRKIAFGGRNGTVQLREVELEGKSARPIRS
jgi:WD40 repeat protein